MTDLSHALRALSAFSLDDALATAEALGVSEERARDIVFGLRQSGELLGPPVGPFRWRPEAPPIPPPPSTADRIMDAAVASLGPTIRYPDGTVTDRRTGRVLVQAPQG